MKFPVTYIDLEKARLDDFRRNFKTPKLGTKVNIISSGTVVIGLLTEDYKNGLIVSDGRVSANGTVVKEDFCKIFDCAVGFIGVAGAVALAQIIMKEFGIALGSICNYRDEPMTASGAARGLQRYYQALLGRLVNGDEFVPLSLVSLFWDETEKRCYLYEYEGLSRLSRSQERIAAIGSGTLAIGSDIKAFPDQPPLRTKEELFNKAKDLLTKPNPDTGINQEFFYGLISDGEFSSGRLS
jgi:20S proteasome alpha/beta subunit